MAFTRKNVAAAVAGTLSLAMLTGCPAAPTAPTPSPSASATAPTSAAPTTATSAAPSAQPSGTASGAPSAAPSVAVSAPPASGKTVIVSGTIRNEKGATVDAATITVKSLDASVPYTATVQTTDGSYVVNNVPEGANVEVVVTKDGFTSRRRVQSFQQSATGQKNILNFGTQAADDDGAAYFISDYPEIASTTPEHDAKGVDPTKLSFKVVLSEAIDEDSRDNFEKNFHIFPVNAEAGGSTTVDIENIEKSSTDAEGDFTFNLLPNSSPNNDFLYVLAEGNTFLGSSTNRVKASWNAAGTEVTYTFDGNLQTGDDESGEYQAALFNLSSGDKIEDAKGNMLGTDDTAGGGSFKMPIAGALIRNAFRDPDLAGNNWALTHKSAVSFEVKPDEVDPKLTGVEVVEDDQDLRIELTFSEPMAAYAGSGLANIDSEVFDLANYSFMLGEKSGDLTNEELEGTNVTFPNRALVAADAKDEFIFATPVGNAFATNGDLDANPNATIAIEVEPDAPSQVNIWIEGGDDLFDAFRSIKARVAGVQDPAGNNITETDADKNLVSATI